MARKCKNCSIRNITWKGFGKDLLDPDDQKKECTPEETRKLSENSPERILEHLRQPKPKPETLTTALMDYSFRNGTSRTIWFGDTMLKGCQV